MTHRDIYSRILLHLEAHYQWQDTRQISHAAGINFRDAQSALESLRDKGLVRAHVPDRGSTTSRWELITFTRKLASGAPIEDYDPSTPFQCNSWDHGRCMLMLHHNGSCRFRSLSDHLRNRDSAHPRS